MISMKHNQINLYDIMKNWVIKQYPDNTVKDKGLYHDRYELGVIRISWKNKLTILGGPQNIIPKDFDTRPYKKTYCRLGMRSDMVSISFENIGDSRVKYVKMFDPKCFDILDASIRKA